MTYIYDILLNWNKEVVYDFFEWEKTDKVEHVKKIPLFRIERGIIQDILNYNIKIDESFMKKVTMQAEIYNLKRITKLPYTFLLSDSESAIAVKCDKFGNILFRSKLIIDEEEEILCISCRLSKMDFLYEKGSSISNDCFLTRNESKIKKFLLNDINVSYNNKKYEKIKYLYTEYFNISIDDASVAYNELINALNEELNHKHNELYNLLQLTANKN